MREGNSGRRGRAKEWKQKGISLRDCGLFFVCEALQYCFLTLGVLKKSLHTNDGYPGQISASNNAYRLKKALFEGEKRPT